MEKLTERQLAIILCLVRSHQTGTIHKEIDGAPFNICADHAADLPSSQRGPVDNDELDDLCEQLNYIEV